MDLTRNEGVTDSDQLRSPEEVGRHVGRRLPGCFTGLLVGLVIMSFGLAMLERFVPALVLSFAGVVVAVAMSRPYASVGEKRWGVRAPDTVEMLLRDLQMIRLKEPDFRIRLPQDSPLSDRLLHEALYILKWGGNFLLVASLAAAMYSAMVALEIVAQ